MNQAGLVILALFVLASVSAREIGTEAGSGALSSSALPNLRVEAIELDRHGYVWIGTQGGLVRHEGLGMTVLRHDPDLPGSLPGNNILSLKATRDGHLWAAVSGQGLVEISDLDVVGHWAPSSIGGVLEGHYIWSIAEACDGAIWGLFAQDGLVRIDRTSGLATHYPAGSHGIPESGAAFELKVDSNCRIWMVRSDQILVSEPGAIPDYRLFVSAADSSLKAFYSASLVRDEALLAVGALGISRFEVDGASSLTGFESRYWDTGELESLVRPAGGDLFWVSNIGGLRLLNAETGEIESVSDAHLPPSSLDKMQIAAIFEGPDGGVWIGTRGIGVKYLSPNWRAFKTLYPDHSGLELELIEVAIADADTGSLWLGSKPEGLQWFDPVTGQSKRFPDVLATRPGRLLSLQVIDDALWVLFGKQLIRLDPETGDTDVIVDQAFDSQIFYSRMWPAGDRGLWLTGLGGGLLRYDSDGVLLDHWHADAAPDRRLLEPDVREMVLGPDGRWWLLGSRALYRQRPDGSFEPFRRSEDSVYLTMAFDGDRLWLASDSVLERYRVHDSGAIEREARFTARSGLPPGRIQTIAPRGGRLWLLLDVGLVRLDAERGEFRTFS
ncbi:MAG: hypothetical protein LC637_01210, partial [Xanthomonadaceae bacterium]|nr:hypothetical protein [Xanthomonadaceae bacterium]